MGRNKPTHNSLPFARNSPYKQRHMQIDKERMKIGISNKLILKARITILISEKLEFKPNLERINVKETMHQEMLRIINKNTPN